MTNTNLGFYPFLEKIKQYVNFDEVKAIFDIGSRDCGESLSFSKEFPNSKIVAFEPNIYQIPICEENIKGVTNIQLVNKALSDFEGQSEFHVTVGNVGASSLLKPHFVPWAADQNVEIIKVDVTTLDSWCEENNIWPDIIWMDVQGNELNTFKGAVKTLKNIKAIYCEAGVIPYYDGHTLKTDILNFLQENGFKLIEEKLDWEREANLILVK